MTVTATTFNDLQLVSSFDDVRRVHNTPGLYFLSRSGVAHAEMDCQHVDPDRLISNRNWRIANNVEAHALGAGWCTDCCS